MTGFAIFSADDILARLTVPDLIEPLARAMINVSRQDALHPPRFAVPINDKGRIGIMYGALNEPPLHGAKVLSLYPDAPAAGLSSHQGCVMLFDSTNGRPLAMFDADAITALRTAAMSMLATRTLARPNPRVITICGSGEQAEWHLRGSLACFPNADIRIWARREDAALQLTQKFPEAAARISVVSDLATAIECADVIHTVTAAKQAFLPGALLRKGQHINLVGASLADAREIDDEAVARVLMFTDALESSNRESGEILGAKDTGAIPKDYPVTELGVVLERRHNGRVSDDEITAFKSHGLIVQDLVAGDTVLRSAQNDASSP